MTGLHCIDLFRVPKSHTETLNLKRRINNIFQRCNLQSLERQNKYYKSLDLNQKDLFNRYLEALSRNINQKM